MKLWDSRGLGWIPKSAEGSQNYLQVELGTEQADVPGHPTVGQTIPTVEAESNHDVYPFTEPFPSSQSPARRAKILLTDIPF
jgi:hypothetical protein